MSFRLYFCLAWIKVGIFGNLQRFLQQLRRRRRGRKLLLSSFFIITFILPIHRERGVFAGMAEGGGGLLQFLWLVLLPGVPPLRVPHSRGAAAAAPALGAALPTPLRLQLLSPLGGPGGAPIISRREGARGAPTGRGGLLQVRALGSARGVLAAPLHPGIFLGRGRRHHFWLFLPRFGGR